MNLACINPEIFTRGHNAQGPSFDFGAALPIVQINCPCCAEGRASFGTLARLSEFRRRTLRKKKTDSAPLFNLRRVFFFFGATFLSFGATF